MRVDFANSNQPVGLSLLPCPPRPALLKLPVMGLRMDGGRKTGPGLAGVGGGGTGRKSCCKAFWVPSLGKMRCMHESMCLSVCP